ncbi:O-antigen ligase family protein [Nodosilinea sp. AN01ver1]|uniref:O-antigen ligase family protein n=1 Tax=Nodosilinea sp. AN01ver1 TaxID=3423362 RepID=UPI003D319390
MTWLPHSYLRMVGWPWALVWQAGFLAIAVWLIRQLRQLDRPFRPLGYGLDWAVAATGLSLIICSLASDFKTVALWNVVLASFYFFALYGGVNWVKQTQVKTTYLAAAIAGSFLGTAVISLALWRPGAESAIDNEFYQALRNAMPFGHHNFVGGYFALALPFVLGCAMAFRGWLRWLAVAATLLTGIALYVSGSRGALLGILVWLLIATAAFVVGSTAKGRPRRLALGGLGLAVIVVVALSNSRVRSLLGSFNLADPSGFVVQDGPLLDRYFLAKVAANILRDRPLVGVGPGVMSRVSNLYRPIEAGLGLDHSQQLHSTPSQLLGEMGLLGLGVYLLWLVLMVRLWLHLHRRIEDETNRWLLYGVGGGFLAYGISSLTDWQLENIGISMALVALVGVLLHLANQAELPQPEPLGGATRRYLSLGLLAWLVMAGYLWLMADLGFWHGDRALHQAKQGNVADSLQHFSSAAALVSWDPTYHALLGQEIYGLLPLVPPAEQSAARQDTLANLYAAVAIAPNDAWFNYNLAVLLRPQDPAAAQVYSQRAVQLLPRNTSLSRYLLGQTYLAQGQTEAAVTAFSLEGVGNPEFLTLPLWQQAPLASLQDPVLDQALDQHQAVLEAMPPDTPGYATYYEQTTLVRWWYQRPQLALAPQMLRPITQALLTTDQNPEAALEIVNQALDQAPQDQGLLLLRAWLQPDEFAQPYFEQANLPPAEQAQLAESLAEYRDLRSWLTAFGTPIQRTGRSLLGLTYRNRYAQDINFIAPLDSVDRWVIPDLLGLFLDFPREFVALDQTVETRQAEQLNLPSAVNNGFEIVPPPVPAEKLF